MYTFFNLNIQKENNYTEDNEIKSLGRCLGFSRLLLRDMKRLRHTILKITIVKTDETKTLERELSAVFGSICEGSSRDYPPFNRSSYSRFTLSHSNTLVLRILSSLNNEWPRSLQPPRLHSGYPFRHPPSSFELVTHPLLYPSSPWTPRYRNPSWFRCP